MKFCICNEIFQEFPLEKQFETAAEIGFAAIEIAPFTLAASVQEIATAQRETIRDLARQTGLEVAGIHWLLAQTEGFHVTSPEPEVRRRTLEYLQDLVRFGVEIGGSMEVVGSPQQRSVLPGVSYKQAGEWFAEAMTACAEVAGAEHFKICLEPLAPSTQNNFLLTAAEALQMVRQINRHNVQVILDCYSGVQMEVDFPAAIRAVGQHLGHFHLNDHNGCAPGYGQTDFVPIMRALLDIGYEGYASIEVFDFSLDPVEQASRGLRTVQEALAAAQES